jgi:hypothetical protein
MEHNDSLEKLVRLSHGQGSEGLRGGRGRAGQEAMRPLNPFVVVMCQIASGIGCPPISLQLVTGMSVIGDRNVTNPKILEPFWCSDLFGVMTWQRASGVAAGWASQEGALLNLVNPEAEHITAALAVQEEAGRCGVRASLGGQDYENAAWELAQMVRVRADLIFY